MIAAVVDTNVLASGFVGYDQQIARPVRSCVYGGKVVSISLFHNTSSPNLAVPSRTLTFAVVSACKRLLKSIRF